MCVGAAATFTAPSLASRHSSSAHPNSDSNETSIPMQRLALSPSALRLCAQQLVWNRWLSADSWFRRLLFAGTASRGDAAGAQESSSLASFDISTLFAGGGPAAAADTSSPSASAAASSARAPLACVPAGQEARFFMEAGALLPPPLGARRLPTHAVIGGQTRN